MFWKKLFKKIIIFGGFHFLVFMLLWGFILSYLTESFHQHLCGNCDEMSAWDGEAGRRCDVITAGRRRRCLRRGSACWLPTLAFRLGGKENICHCPLSLGGPLTTSPTGDGRRPWRRVVGEPACRCSQQPRYPLCPRGCGASPDRTPPHPPCVLRWASAHASSGGHDLWPRGGVPSCGSARASGMKWCGSLITGWTVWL